MHTLSLLLKLATALRTSAVDKLFAACLIKLVSVLGCYLVYWCMLLAATHYKVNNLMD